MEDAARGGGGIFSSLVPVVSGHKVMRYALYTVRISSSGKET